MIEGLPDGFQAILRLHVDLTAPNTSIIEFLKPYIDQYHYIIVSNPSYEKGLLWEGHPAIKTIAPAINPLSEKNRPMALATAQQALLGFNINTNKPIISQISRFDPWKDPIGVIDAYYSAKNKIPDLQLILAGIKEALDDPQQIEFYQKAKKHSADDRDVFLFFEPEDIDGVSVDSFINAVQTASDVILQKSIREGFGLTMTEAMWKGKAVIAGATAGAMTQIKNAENGFIVSSTDETAETIIYLLENPTIRETIGAKARASVRERFLTPRLLLDSIEIYNKLHDLI